MASEVFNLAILLSLKDAASGGLDRAGGRIRALGKEGKLLAETFDDLRESLNRDFAMGGVGVSGLMLLKNGVDEAGRLETTTLNLRQAYQEVASASGKSREKQETDIRKIMQMATELGNQLQGNTSTYAEIFTAMNKSGIEAETTLTGAGKAAAYLANVTGAIRKGTHMKQAEDLGSFGKMFDLKGDDYMKVVELFSALEDRFNIGSSDLVEASKYFFSTAKGVMNLRGLSGAEDTAKLFAFSKRYAGREGSEAGTSLDAILTQFIAHKKKVEDLAKDKGIKLEFFDTKGNFQGVENMFAQLEKLKKLSPEERGMRLNAIFGEQGARIAGAMVEQGVQGWRNITAEAQKSVSVNEKIKQQMETYEAKSEALSGSWQNFRATAFTPLMEDTKKFLDSANSMVGSMQKFSAENQGLMKTLGTLALYGSTALVVVGGIKSMTTAWRLWRIASTISRGEGLLPYLSSTTTAAASTSAALQTATTKATGFRSAMQRIGTNSSVRIGVQIGAIIGIEYAISKAIESYMAAKEATEGKYSAIRYNNTAMTNLIANKDVNDEEKSKLFKGQAQTDLFTLRAGGLFRALGLESSKGWGEYFYDGLSSGFVGRKFFGANNFTEGLSFSREQAVKKFKSDAPTLGNPQVMREFLKYLPERIPGNDPASIKARTEIQQTAREAFPDSFAAAMRELSTLSVAPLTQGITDFSNQVNTQKQTFDLINPSLQSFGQNLTDLQQPMFQTNSNITDLANSAQKVPTPLNNVATSANSASNSLNSLSSKIENWQPPVPSVQTYQFGVPQNQSGTATPFSLVPSRAVGGIVERDGLAMVHAGNIITPARVTKGLKLSNDIFKSGLQTLDIKEMISSDSSQSSSFVYSPQITINGADADADKKFQAMLNKHAREIDRIVARRMQNGRVRA